MRTEYCGQLRLSHVGQQVTLCGWVNRRRDLGSLIFIDMRDREGIVQVFFDPDRADALKLASEPVSYTHLDVYKRQMWH